MGKCFVKHIVAAGLLCFLCLGCRSSRAPAVLSEVLPAVPDYSDTTQWYTVDRQAAVDLFYVVSTETGDYTVDGHLQTFTSDSLTALRIPLAMDDVRRAFAYYLSRLNNGRPFILAGFSQGGTAVVELLKMMDSATRSRLVAAYVIGWHVTDSDLAHTPNIIPARDSADFGVTVCYNSVRDNSCAIPLISQGNRMAVNPVNWRTDATPAILPSPLSPDTLTVTLDTSTLLLQVQGYSKSSMQPSSVVIYSLVIRSFSTLFPFHKGKTMGDISKNDMIKNDATTGSEGALRNVGDKYAKLSERWRMVA